MAENAAQNLSVCILNSYGRRQYVRPTSNEITTLVVGDGCRSEQNRDIVIQKLDGHLHRIDETHPSYMGLQYPLIFPIEQMDGDGLCNLPLVQILGKTGYL